MAFGLRACGVFVAKVAGVALRRSLQNDDQRHLVDRDAEAPTTAATVGTEAMPRIFSSGGTEASLEGRVHAFAALGGVPTGRIRCDKLAG
ncbi:hypothetical protein [Dactylosporangium sp. NPDC051541]|uniref:hypothetical protein n=1 Tax=Dactylosporangium sp. NPDC051541 TaxID=3363977 RepID=UPI0037A6680F